MCQYVAVRANQIVWQRPFTRVRLGPNYQHRLGEILALAATGATHPRAEAGDHIPGLKAILSRGKII